MVITLQNVGLGVYPVKIQWFKYFYSTDLCNPNGRPEHFPECVRNAPEHIATYQALLGVSRSLERIADCATNIAEDVIYLESGRIVRHANSRFSCDGEHTSVIEKEL